MLHSNPSQKKLNAFLFTIVIICCFLLVGNVASADDRQCPEFTLISDGGFGNPQNNYAWSMAEFKGDIYVGTGRNVPYMVSLAMKRQGVFPANMTLSFLTHPAGSPPPSLYNPNETPPSPEEVIAWSNDMRAEIWRYHEGTWTQVHQASTFINPLDGYTYPEGVGYRIMTPFTDTGGTEALYAGVGFGFGRVLIIRSTDGITWEPVNTAGIPSRDTRAMTAHNGKLYVGTGDGIYASACPSTSTDTWEKVADFQVASLKSFNGYLYAGTGNPNGPSETNGFEVWRSSTASPEGPDDWVRVVSGGAGDAWNVLAASMQDYRGDLFVGSMNLPFGTGTEGLKGFDLIRVDTGDSWDLIVGNYHPKIPTDPRGPPLSGWPSGYANPFNLYAWSIEEYHGNLYLGTFDIFSLARYISEVPGGEDMLLDALASRSGSDTGSTLQQNGAIGAFLAGLGEINQTTYGDGENIVPAIEFLARNFGGADLWTSPDGVLWVPVELNGFDDPNNYGFRTMLTTQDEFMIGTANPFNGCQVWVASGPESPPDSVSNLHNATYLPDRITWNWTDPTSENFSHVIVCLDGEFMENVPKGVQTFTATGLDPDREYTLGTRTVSTGGLVNATWVNHTARTAPVHSAWKFRSDLWNSGVYDDGGTRPEGALLWSYNTGDDVDSSPAVVDGVIYIGEYALDAKTGEVLWTFRPHNSIDSSPAVANGTVYVGCENGNLYALNADAGGVLWNYTTGAGVQSSPAVADGIVYFGSKDHNVYALDAETGDLVWNYTTGGAIYSSPAVIDGVVYIGSCDKNVYALDAETGDLVWNYTTGGMVYSSPAVVDGQVYIGSFDGLFYVLHADTGEFFWSYAAGEPVYSSPAVVDGIVYFGCRNGFLYALNTEIPGYRWSYHAGEGVDSSPAVANGVVYFTSTDNPGASGLYALDALTGELLWKYDTRSGLKSSPAVADGVVYFGSRDRGSIFAIGPDLGPANLMLGKLAPAFYENATDMTSTLFYRNQGPGTAGEVILTEYLPASVEFVSGTNYPVYNDTAGTVTWYLGSLISQASGSQSLTVRIPSSVPYGTVLTNTANISTATPESRYDDNTASADTTVMRLWLPPGVAVSPSVPGPWGEICVDWRDETTFSYNQSTCPPETPVSIRIHLDDGGPDITAPMTGGPQYWYYTTSFYPRHGAATVTYETPGCIISGITFDLKVDPAGYVYDTVSGNRIAGAEVWLQWPDDEGNWVNVPTGLVSPPMEPDVNPLTTNAAGQFQWEVEEGSYRVYAETDGYAPAATTMVNAPPQFSDLAIGLDPVTGNIWVSSTPTGAEISLDGSDTGFVTSHELAGVSPGQHEVALRLAGYRDYNETVTVTAGHTVTIQGTLIPFSPASVTGLHNTTYQPDSITWAWTDPDSAGFDHVMVYLDGVFRENVTKGVQSFTAGSLAPGTSYEIGTRTVGASGLVNATWVNHTAMTAPSHEGPTFSVLLPQGWNLFSTPVLLAQGYSQFPQIFTGTEQEKILIVLGWDGSVWYIPQSGTEVKPLDAFYVRVSEGEVAHGTIVPSTVVSTPPARQVNTGVNLVGVAPAYDPETQSFQDMPLTQALSSIEYVHDLRGYSIVVSPGLNQPGWSYALGGTVYTMKPFKGYWVIMENGPDTLYGFSTTPISN